MDLLTAALLLPLDIQIDPNSNGLPGIGQLKKIVVALGAAIVCGASVTLVNFFWNVGQQV